MKRKILSYLSYGSLALGVALSAYALVKIYLLRSELPAGVCPVTNNRPLLYVAITLCCIAFVLSFFEPKAVKKQDNN